jgi:hypothetical protein
VIWLLEALELSSSISKEQFMSATTGATSGGRDRDAISPAAVRTDPRRLSTETKASYRTTEFFAYLVILAGILIAGAVTSAGVDKNGVRHLDVFPAHQVWLYATILTVGYMISRGLAKAGSRDPYDADRRA